MFLMLSYEKSKMCDPNYSYGHKSNNSRILGIFKRKNVRIVYYPVRTLKTLLRHLKTSYFELYSEPNRYKVEFLFITSWDDTLFDDRVAL